MIFRRLIINLRLNLEVPVKHGMMYKLTTSVIGVNNLDPAFRIFPEQFTNPDIAVTKLVNSIQTLE